MDANLLANMELGTYRDGSSARATADGDATAGASPLVLRHHSLPDVLVAPAASASSGAAQAASLATRVCCTLAALLS